MSQQVEQRADRFGSWTAERLAQIPEYKRLIVEGIRSGLWISEISEQIRVGTAAIANWRQQDPVFGAQYKEAEDAFIDTLEREAVRRAMHGVADVIVSNGKIVMDPRTASDPDGPKPLLRRNYSDGLMMFILKGRRREVYGDKVETENRHTVNFEDAKARLAQKLMAVAGSAARREVSGDRGVSDAAAQSGAAAEPDAGPGTAEVADS